MCPYTHILLLDCLSENFFANNMQRQADYVSKDDATVDARGHAEEVLMVIMSELICGYQECCSMYSEARIRLTLDDIGGMGLAGARGRSGGSDGSAGAESV